ncbi:DNA cytosine methyltransferase [Tsukamurella conjunctivitidis]|nr:DNA cytosine methyltransferase [Tsukamurella conjunctivitidis]
MPRPRLLDLYCCAGGAAVGYHRAGFDIVGVDIDPQPNYPFTFVQADALKFLLESHSEFEAYHGSPPCQAFTNAQRIQGNDHPDFITATRSALKLIGKPYVIENVPGAPLDDPFVLCGAMFPGLKTYRHRLFESNIPIWTPRHPEHAVPTTKMGRKPVAGQFMHVVGNFSGVQQAREAMGIDWMTRDELREAIPPAYTEHIGRQLIAALVGQEALF